MGAENENLLDVETHFAFGRNWIDYAKKIDREAIASATENLRRLSGDTGLEGRSFLDIGCGSGLHSLAALHLGASRVYCVDIDSDSVAAAERTLARFAPGSPSSFKTCSVFDMTSAEFGRYDVVYSWGVLHHTGDMRRAIRAAAGLVAPGGELYLALYKKTPFCGMWRVIKRWYSRAGAPAQKRARAADTAVLRAVHWVTGTDFNALKRGYGKARGMNFQNDRHDWLGGYPYESISPHECQSLLDRLGFTAEREFIQRAGRYLPGITGSGCDEYVFRRRR